MHLIRTSCLPHRGVSQNVRMGCTGDIWDPLHSPYLYTSSPTSLLYRSNITRIPLFLILILLLLILLLRCFLLRTPPCLPLLWSSTLTT